jgi:alkylhydroperoxidase family enzyme
MNQQEHLQFLEGFSAHYRYDANYIREFLQGSPEGYAKLHDFLPLAAHREFLPLDSYWVAKLAASQVADCGQCLQLSVRMALEAGVSPQLVRACIQGGSKLPEELKDIFDFATGVASYRSIDPLLGERIEAQLDKSQRTEMGVAIATASMFPTIKRALGYTQSCSLVEIEFAA